MGRVHSMIMGNSYRPVELVNVCPARRDALIEVTQISKKAAESSNFVDGVSSHQINCWKMQNALLNSIGSVCKILHI